MLVFGSGNLSTTQECPERLWTERYHTGTNVGYMASSDAGRWLPRIGPDQNVSAAVSKKGSRTQLTPQGKRTCVVCLSATRYLSKRQYNGIKRPVDRDSDIVTILDATPGSTPTSPAWILGAGV